MVTDKGYSIEFENNLTCFNCRKVFSSKWHLEKHLEAGKCKHYTEKRYAPLRLKKRSMQRKVKLYTCDVCWQRVDGVTLDRHLQSGKCK